MMNMEDHKRIQTRPRKHLSRADRFGRGRAPRVARDYHFRRIRTFPHQPVDEHRLQFTQPGLLR